MGENEVRGNVPVTFCDQTFSQTLLCRERRVSGHKKRARGKVSHGTCGESRKPPSARRFTGARVSNSLGVRMEMSFAGCAGAGAVGEDMCTDAPCTSPFRRLGSTGRSCPLCRAFQFE